MDFELKFTSAESGVKRSAQGFCTVLATAGMPPPLMERLESLSVYRHLFPAGQPGEERNPIAFSHLVVPVFGEPHHVVSRVQSAGLDYSKRFNYFAHHRAIEAGNLPSGGPAWVAGQESVLQPRWDGLVATPPACKPIPAGNVAPAVCRHWQSVTGDAGWAGWILERWQANPEGEISVIFSPGDPALELVQECVALLPAAARWRLTFSTFATKLPPDVGCNLRFVAAGTPEAARAKDALDLRSIRGKSPPDSPIVEAAREGREAPIATTALRTAAAESPSPTAYKATNLGELPPLPTAQSSRPRYHADVGTPPLPSNSSRNVTLILLAAAIMLGGAGYMFWDAQQREAARFAAAVNEQQEKEDERRKAKEDEDRKFEERRRKADEDAERERERKKAQLDATVQEERDAKKKEHDKRKAKEEADNKAKDTARNAKQSSRSQSEMTPSATYGNLPALTYLKKEIKTPFAGDSKERPQTVFENKDRLKISSLALHTRAPTLYSLKKGTPHAIVHTEANGDKIQVAGFGVFQDRIEFTWYTDRSHKEVRDMLRESVLELLDASGQSIALIALRVPMEREALYCAWTTHAFEAPKGNNAKATAFNRPRMAPEECQTWNNLLSEFNEGLLHVQIESEIDLAGNPQKPLFHSTVGRTNPSKPNTVYSQNGRELVKGEVSIVPSRTSTSLLPLRLTFTPSGDELRKALEKHQKLATDAAEKAANIQKQTPGDFAKQLAMFKKGTPEQRQSAADYEAIKSTERANEDLANSFKGALDHLSAIWRTRLVGSVFFIVPIGTQKIRVDVISFRVLPSAQKNKDGKK